jgi:ATP-binding cassette subfamily F protein uup
MDKLADQLFILTGEGDVKAYIGSYTDYREEEKEEKKKEAKGEISKSVEVPIEKITPVAATPKQKMSYKEKFEFESLEKEIAELEKKKKILEEQLNNTGTDHTELLRITTELGEATRMVDEKQMRWLELSEMI